MLAARVYWNQLRCTRRWYWRI